MQTKKSLLLVALCILHFLAQAQSDYKSALGIRLTTHIPYDVLAASYKNFLGDHGALEFNFGFGGRNMYIPGSGGRSGYSPGVSFSGSYQYHEDIYTPTHENLRWFAGGGMVVFNIFSKNNFYEGFGTGLFATGGIDYTFKSVPVNLTADWRPTVFIASPSAFPGINIGTIGIAARYTL